MKQNDIELLISLYVCPKMFNRKLYSQYLLIPICLEAWLTAMYPVCKPCSDIMACATTKCCSPLGMGIASLWGMSCR